MLVLGGVGPSRTVLRQSADDLTFELFGLRIHLGANHLAKIIVSLLQLANDLI